ncbi:hypothetical protein [Cryobacterium zhongshanensis]|uniref:Uncharacterized protein n=1 Tax=Cryobacterium zhongshanensis TaxID=2928153 RepID=A0AA41UGW3_9MICO|nr:hypothetical protein [Cryobacterium zhongshanensis]MCI4659300.1 hypothetical protein [Cryobacterium zhongshanensis]
MVQGSRERMPSGARPFRGASVSGRRALAAIVLCVLATGALTACSPQGNAANKWMRDHPIVQSSSMHLDGCEAMCDPNVSAKIKDSATDDQVRQLARDSAQYLAGKNALRMSLEYHRVTLFVDEDATTTSALADILIAITHDPAVTDGMVDTRGLDLVTTKAQLLPVYTAYSAGSPAPVSVRTSWGGDGFSLSNEAPQLAADGGAPTCLANANLLAVVGDLIADPEVTSLDASMCSDTNVGTIDIAAVTRVAAVLQPLAADPLLAANTFTVSVDGDLASDSLRTVTAASAGYGPFLDFLGALPGVTTYRTTADGTIAVSPVAAGQCAAVTTAIDAEPRPAGVSKVAVSCGSYGVYVNGDGTVPAQLGLVAALAALGTGDAAVPVYVSPTRLSLTPHQYTPVLGRQIVDAVIASGLWKTRPTEIAVFDRPTVFTVEWEAGGEASRATRSDATDPTKKLLADLDAQWTAQRLAQP